MMINIYFGDNIYDLKIDSTLEMYYLPEFENPYKQFENLDSYIEKSEDFIIVSNNDDIYRYINKIKKMADEHNVLSESDIYSINEMNKTLKDITVKVHLVNDNIEVIENDIYSHIDLKYFNEPLNSIYKIQDFIMYGD